MNDKRKIQFADDEFESVITLFRLRTPSLVIGLLLGIGISFATSRFEEVLSHNVQVAFFLPFIVYMADAVGTQTEAIYSRCLKTGKAEFSKFFKKELFLGIIFGIIFGLCSGIIAFLWLHNELLAISVTTASFLAIAIAPLIALSITYFFQAIGKDPAAGSGPITTVLQDMSSVIIYGLVCTVILL